MRRVWLALVVLMLFTVVSRFGFGAAPSWWSAPLEYETKGDGAHLDRADATSAVVCGSCHVRHYDEWRQSAMAKSVEYSRFLIDLYAFGLDVRGAPVEDVEMCLRCHAPLAMVGDEPDLMMESDLVQEGVTCVVCHAATQAHADKNPGRLTWDFNGPMRGQLYGTLDAAVPEDAVIASSSFHATVRSDLQGSSELCGSCHMSEWPTNGLPIDWTYMEWAESAYAEEGTTCQDCHMETYRGRAAPTAPIRDNLHDHRFPGRNDGEMVRSTATVALAISSNPSEGVAIVENVGAGHAFPTGNATAPSVMLEVSVFDDAGGVLATHRFEHRLVYGDADGNPVRDPTAASMILSDTALQPRIPQEHRFEVPVGAAKIEGVLVYSPWEHAGVQWGTVLEFAGRYIRNGYAPEKVVKHLNKLHQTSPPRGADKIEVTRAVLSL
jgi:nitrate/TMAO reductase-like tetraheme cytochrome c subunit